MFSPTGDLVAAARARGTGVGAFNVITVEHAEAIVTGAEEADLPVILQISENAVRFHHGRLAPIAAAARRVAEQARVPVALHLDHVEDDDLLDRAAANGFGSVMYDASRRGYDDNVAATSAAVRRCHAQGLDHELIARLRAAVPVPLVLHGSSGVPDEELTLAVRGGLAKINIGTALNTAFTAAVREALGADPAMVDPRQYLKPARSAMATSVAHFLRLLASR